MSNPAPVSRRSAWKKFRANPLAMAGMIFILLVALVCILGPFIRQDSTVNANNQDLTIAGQKPGFSVNTIRKKQPFDSDENVFGKWWNGGANNPYKEIAVSSVELKGDTLVIAEWSAKGRKNKIIREHIEQLEKRGDMADTESYLFKKTFLLGTDKYGRDLLSRIMAGATISLLVGAIAVIISLIVGLTLGLVAGYFRGLADNIIMWFTNVVWAIPTLLLVMAITFAFGTGFWKVFLAVGLTMWVEVARIARGQVLSAREKEYVEAARALGYSTPRIIFRHILPNILSPIIVISAANFAGAILIEAGLSFLGLGAQIPTPSWGNMIREHYGYITTDLAYLAIIPGVMIMLLVLAFMMVGNGLRDALDVHD